MGGGGPAAPARPREVLDAVPSTVDVALSAVAGVTAAACMSPFILTIDRAVTEYAAGNSGLLTALRTGTMEFVRRPLRVVCSAPLVMVVGVYVRPQTRMLLLLLLLLLLPSLSPCAPPLPDAGARRAPRTPRPTRSTPCRSARRSRRRSIR